jgi:hypothetical protein
VSDLSRRENVALCLSLNSVVSVYSITSSDTWALKGSRVKDLPEMHRMLEHGAARPTMGRRYLVVYSHVTGGPTSARKGPNCSGPIWHGTGDGPFTTVAIDNHRHHHHRHPPPSPSPSPPPPSPSTTVTITTITSHHVVVTGVVVVMAGSDGWC